MNKFSDFFINIYNGKFIFTLGLIIVIGGLVLSFVNPFLFPEKLTASHFISSIYHILVGLSSMVAGFGIEYYQKKQKPEVLEESTNENS